MGEKRKRRRRQIKGQNKKTVGQHADKAKDSRPGGDISMTNIDMLDYLIPLIIQEELYSSIR